MTEIEGVSQRALVLALQGRDAEVACAILEEAGLSAVACTDIPCLARELEAGAGVAVVTEESLRDADLHAVAAWIEAQPAWSDLPFVLLTQRGGGVERNPTASRLSATLGNVTFLERPFHPTTLISVVQTALRGRRRQYEARARLEAIREGEQKLLVALEAGRLGPWELDVSAGELISSETCRAHFGRAADEPLTYADFQAAIHPEDRDKRAAALERTLSTGSDYDAEYRVIWRDGSVHWIAIRARLLRDEKTGSVRMIGVSLDVTEPRVAEEAVRESEHRFRLMADSAQVTMWVTEPTGRRGFVNQAYLDFLGVSYEEAIAFDWRKILHPDDMSRILGEQLAGESSLRPFWLEARYRRADGEWRWIRSQSQPRWGPSGEHQGFVGLAYDITDSKRAQFDLQRINDLLEERVAAALVEKGEAEMALRQAQRLEAVGQLTSGVAHDFNNLLTVVLGNIRMLDRTATDPSAKRRLGMMEQAAQRGATLTAQLLAFSRRQKLEPRPVDLNETVRGMRDLLQSTMGGSVRLETEFEPELWPALIDPTQIELVILNLAINARDAMEVGGALTVRTANVELGPPDRPEAPPAGEYVMVSVADTGSGMPDDVLAKAFEPFFTTKEVGKGSGLGLSQVFGLAKQSGGGVSIETSVGEGTVVKVYLPRTEVVLETGDEVAASSPPRSRGDAEVLVVDDDGGVREITSAMLHELGYGVVEASSGPAALHVLDTGAGIDLMLLDFAMPGMNGVEVARVARERRPDLPILFVTGYADTAVLSEATEDEIVQKPFGEMELAGKVNRLLRRKARAKGEPARV